MIDETAALDRLRDRVGDIEKRVGGIEKFVERIDERLAGKLTKDDADKLMLYTTESVGVVRKDFVERQGDFRFEVREYFKHSEAQTASFIYKATTESEARTHAEIQGITNQVTAVGNQLTAIAAALAECANNNRRGFNPLWTYGGGGFSVASVIALLLYFSGLKIPGMS